MELPQSTKYLTNPWTLMRSLDYKKKVMPVGLFIKRKK